MNLRDAQKAYKAKSRELFNNKQCAPSLSVLADVIHEDEAKRTPVPKGWDKVDTSTGE